MTSEQIVIGIGRLHPEAEFSFKNGDYSTIQWQVLNGTAPTIKEIEAAYAAYIKDEANKAQILLNKKQEVLTKLGLTADEVAALLA